MDLNEVKLTPFLLSRLYPDVLVSSPENQDSSDGSLRLTGIDEGRSEVPAWICLGANKKLVTVAVRVPGVTHLPDDQFELLTKMLKACRLGLEDVAIVNLVHYDGISGNQIMEHFKTRVVLLFGITPGQFGFPFEIPHFQPQQFADVQLIHGPALSELPADHDARAKLWAGLRTIFSV